MCRKIGVNLSSSGYRTYRNYTLNGKPVHQLICWSQRKCQRCQRFLSKEQIKHCVKCAKLYSDEQTRVSIQRPEYKLKHAIHSKKWHAEHREQLRVTKRNWRSKPENKERIRLYRRNWAFKPDNSEQKKLRGFVRTHADELEVGQIV